MRIRLEDIKDPAQRKRFADAAGITDPAKTGLLPPTSTGDLAREISGAVFKMPKPRMNGTETEFHGMLAMRGYQKVQFEGITLELATGARYTPDFYCVRNQSDFSHSVIHLYETKNNFIREAAIVRLKVAARQFPEFTFILAQKKKGVWTETVVRP